MILKIQKDKKIACELILKKTWCGDFEIDYIKTHPDFRGQGLASKLIEKAKQKSIENKVSLIAFIEPDGTGLTREQEIEWLKRRGFKSTKYDFGGFTKPVMEYTMEFNSVKK